MSAGYHLSTLRILGSYRDAWLGFRPLLAEPGGRGAGGWTRARLDSVEGRVHIGVAASGYRRSFLPAGSTRPRADGGGSGARSTQRACWSGWDEMSQTLGLLGVPSSAGAFAPGQEQAPQAMRQMGLV